MIRAWILIASFSLALAVACAAQTPQTGENPELVRAQIEKEKAAAEYYRGQLEIARQEAKDKSPQHYASVIDKYTHKDPADFVESVAAILGVLLIFVMFVSTFRMVKRDQRDARFFEALKRFGDPSSPALRSSSAGILAQMGRMKEYSDTALDQLVSGLILEDDPVVRTSAANAIRGLARGDMSRVSARLEQSPPEIREKARSALGI